MSAMIRVCAVSDLIENAGIPAWFDGRAIALFYVAGQVYALSNHDPIGQANVMSRGMLGSIQGVLVVASPLYKEHYRLDTGVCLEHPEQALTTYAVQVADGQVWVGHHG